MPLLAAVIAGNKLITSIFLILALFSQCVEFYKSRLHTIIYYTIKTLSLYIGVPYALMLLVVIVLLVICPALVKSIGDSIISLISTPFLLYTLGILFIININNKFSLFYKLN